MKKKKHNLTRLFSCVFIIFHLAEVPASAQGDALKNPDQFLFPVFAEGRIAMKTGNDITLTMNYHVVTETMVAIRNGKMYDMVNPGSYDTIYMNGRKFIPSDNVYYEVIAEKPVPVYIRHKATVTQPSKRDSYGAVSESVATNSIYNMKVGAEFYNLSDPDIIIKREMVYLIVFNATMMSFKDMTQFLKIYPDKKSQIRDYARKNGIKFSNPEDVIKLVTFSSIL